ncbi:TniB family NTP-binding protein [Streptomyces tsukubensis]|uniref:AAA family ATPase n=1 Tax=Streptomyces tsukubensis TaxID=83656 RepID=A0A1V4AEQ1_9ACTN|nr:TniB family NTP-binding protein [Streptomyces tsukubensis]OON82083.1 AAA family ATPase [Streptomyces tsukubensis]QFR92565.1 AAA family ATPase [Streptomyces tsukubensis]
MTEGTSPLGRPLLDNLTLSRKEGFRQLAEAPRRIQPDKLTVKELAALSKPARAVYDRQRRDWHANLGPIRTPQLIALQEDLWDIVDSNLQDGDKAKGAVAVDAFPGLGKTTAVLHFAQKFHLREISEGGEFTQAGQERWPVCRVGLTSNIGMKDFNRAILEFFAHPARFRGTSAEFLQRALDCILDCETRILIVDDLHFLKWSDRNGREVSNHFKHIANEFPVTLIFVGVELASRGLYSETDQCGDVTLAQTARRTTPLSMEPFLVNEDRHRKEWRKLLLWLEKRIVLAEKFPGMLANELSDYFYARTTGHIGSLMTLVNRGCQRAVRTGTERLDVEILNSVKIDAASEKAREQLEASLRARRWTSKTSEAHTVATGKGAGG